LLLLERHIRDYNFDGGLDCRVVTAGFLGQIAPSYQSRYFALIHVHGDATRSAAAPLPVTPGSFRRGGRSSGRARYNFFHDRFRSLKKAAKESNSSDRSLVSMPPTVCMVSNTLLVAE
jgi:hypothetical protein